jgi:beta-N-acetylhexosaminidase
MTQQVLEDAHAVLLPAFDAMSLDDSVRRHLSSGGRSILLGESRLEYVTRSMSTERVETETADRFSRVASEAQALAGPTIISVDQEINGIGRLHKLTPSFPPLNTTLRMSIDEVEVMAGSIARAARAFGVNAFLAPVLDVLRGPNPWLEGRTISSDPEVVARISSAYIRGIQSVGVAAVAKHFPGFHEIALDPAIDEDAVVFGDANDFELGFIPFCAAIASGVQMIMMGPAIVRAYDPVNPASTSPQLVSLLREKFQFSGLIMSDDLDSRAVARDKVVPEIAVDAISAGVDLCMMAAGVQLESAANAIVLAVAQGKLKEERLAEAASRVRNLADRIG